MVLDNDDLLRLILFRLAFCVSLIRAALCKRWLSIASDPAFLCHFRKLHSALLGFYLKCRNRPSPKLVAMPHTEELSAIIWRASSVFDVYSGMWALQLQSQNGRLLGKFHGRGTAASVVLSPLNLQSSTVVLPPLPSIGKNLGMTICPLGYLLNDQACFASVLLFDQERTTVHLYELIYGVWKSHTTAAIDDCPVSCFGIKILLTNHRLYIISFENKILGLDFMSLILSVIELPEEVDRKHILRLSQADDTGFYLVHVKELELRVWLYTHRTNSRGMDGDWLLVHTICLREVSANLRMPIPVPENLQNSIVKLHALGTIRSSCSWRYAELSSTWTSRAAQKVYTFAPDEGDFFSIHPFVMIWPPTFPCHQGKTGPKGTVQPAS